MQITLPVDLSRQVEQALADGCYRSPDELIETALRQFLHDHERAQQRLEALRRLGQKVEEAGLYEAVFVPDEA